MGISLECSSSFHKLDSSVKKSFPSSSAAVWLSCSSIIVEKRRTCLVLSLYYFLLAIMTNEVLQKFFSSLPGNHYRLKNLLMFQLHSCSLWFSDCSKFGLWALGFESWKESSKSANPYLWLPRCFSCKGSACQCRRHGFHPWVRKILWRGKWQPTAVFLPGKSHGQRSLAGNGPWGRKESDNWAIEQQQQPNICVSILFQILFPYRLLRVLRRAPCAAQ